MSGEKRRLIQATVLLSGGLDSTTVVPIIAVESASTPLLPVIPRFTYQAGYALSENRDTAQMSVGIPITYVPFP